MNYSFEINGKIDAFSVDDAINLLQLILEDNQIKINRLSVGNRYIGVIARDPADKSRSI